ncbi:1-deoxy-D-xylulose-5-phosphate synthase [Permianibacter aggregans]|uniref:1-deoxy-D-xylulose-5-phosphate synthase n=1 Tax=Permianibacter aggregans TaxID=1510150 RepID=A0A4R6UVZ4_9GAMM|nr:1-deoxy-D-xylulose-5-phosphate synthase [Permianibacter aggregans]QGX39098.1 1-deoxy-D-xylulose-5-phosphate synthase [Permianibacter aggregans]TDQ47694.1 1-deoxy-D-xylulose-5-phosphate synthase [Permianibacter aggregans]
MPADLTQFPQLARINTPDDLRALPREELQTIAAELRQYLIDTISGCGGHFAAGLGTVELTVALHYIFHTPDDRLVWDVGHQAYPHKVLTGRRDRLHTIRQHDGLHPFPTPQESEYDTFAVGHSSTSISAALGMALAAKQRGEDRKTVAIIGDGAMTAGMAFEALNHAGDLDVDLLVVLNDNDMSISENVGALNNYFARLLSSRFYNAVRDTGKKVLSPVPPLKELVHRAEEHMKGMVLPGTLFEELGFNYIGPVDGHDLNVLLDTLNNLKTQKGPRLLHVVTRKGKGFEPAENDPIAYHGVPVFNPKDSTLPSGKPKKTYSNVFGDFICDIAAQDERVFAVTPAMREGSDLIRFSREFPERYFDVAIAEQHAVTLAAGLAKEGMKPVVAIYSTFLQRAYDQLIHDVCLMDLDVLFAIDRGGLVGGDGATHNGAFDLSYLRCVPNLIIMAPSDENECRQMLYTGWLHKGPAAVRYPRGTGFGITPEKAFTALAIGKAKVLRQGQDIAVLNFGAMLSDAQQAAEALNATLVDMRFIKPLDETLLRELAKTHSAFITVEENAVIGGAGSAVNELVLNQGLGVRVKNFGLSDRFIEHGDVKRLRSEDGLSAEAIIAYAQKEWK